MKVGGDDEAVRLMNDSPYGLTAAIWTRDEARAQRIGAQLETGTVFHEPLRLPRPGAGLDGGEGLRSGLHLVASWLRIPDTPEELSFEDAHVAVAFRLVIRPLSGKCAGRARILWIRAIAERRAVI